MTQRTILALLLTGLLSLGVSPATWGQEAASRPVLKDFLGINGHFTFKPELYAPVAKMVRNYHPADWDLGHDSDFVTEFPFARNRVNWEHTYSDWKRHGLSIHASLMLETLKQEQWKSPAEDVYRYAKAYATALGPSSRNLIDAVEIGNEPGEFDDKFYRTVFEAAAKGLRDGDPKIKVATCNVLDGPSNRYTKSLSCVQGLESLYDILNVHTYAEAEPWPTWRRSYPEDSTIPYLKDIRSVVDWRNRNAPGKQIWVTEYGWDSTTKPQQTSGDFAKWVGVTDVQQAQYLVRSTMIFMTLDIDRAFLYFYNDDDEAKLHSASGLTRNFVPKPSYYAMKHLQNTLGNYRLSRVIESKPDELYAYEFKHANDGSIIVAAWSPTGIGREAVQALPLDGRRVVKAERMPLDDRPPFPVVVGVEQGTAQVPVQESPIYLWLQ